MKFSLLIVALVSLVCSCSQDISYDELWREKIDLPNGSHLMLYHSGECTKQKPFFAVKERRIDFVQYKNDVFDFCLSKHEIDALYAISQSNIQNRIDNWLPEELSEYDNQRKWKCLIDTTYRQYECYYGLKNNAIIELDNVFIP